MDIITSKMEELSKIADQIIQVHPNLEHDKEIMEVLNQRTDLTQEEKMKILDMINATFDREGF